MIASTTPLSLGFLWTNPFGFSDALVHGLRVTIVAGFEAASVTIRAILGAGYTGSVAHASVTLDFTRVLALRAVELVGGSHLS